MQYNINISHQINKNDNLILLYKSYDEIQNDFFSSEELKWIEQKKETKEKLITINQYKRFIFIIITKSDIEEYLILENIRKTANSLSSVFLAEKIETIQISGEKQFVTSLIEGLLLGLYRFDKYQKENPKKRNLLKEISVISENTTQKEVDELANLLHAVYNTRDIVNEPVSVLDVAEMCNYISKMGKDAGYSTEILNKKQIEALRMNGLLTVNKGSIDPPAFIISEWKPENAINSRPYVLVGKGVTFDTGGYNIKTESYMTDMKCDMGGGATVAGTLYAVAKSKLPIHVIALIPTTDNRISGNAAVPGDIIKMANDVTVEVLNTDAEGRLILADALYYAQKYKPELVIDVATLTGSAQRALGQHAIAAMGNAPDNEFQQLENNGFNCFERIHRFPFWDDYNEMIKSSVADIANVGGSTAGAITAGKFLEHFVDYPWMHLDIATNAFLEKNDSYRKKGGTGIGVRLLFNFLKQKAEVNKLVAK